MERFFFPAFSASVWAYLPLVKVVVSTDGYEVLETRLPHKLGVHQLVHDLRLQDFRGGFSF